MQFMRQNEFTHQKVLHALMFSPMTALHDLNSVFQGLITVNQLDS
jgi:hypothetical protein